MKIIKDIENKVITALDGEKVSTFRLLIFQYADYFIKNKINGAVFIKNTSTLSKGYEKEFNKHINFYKYCQKYHLYNLTPCNICQKMIDLSYDTWERVKFIRKSSLPLKINEVTITENLLFELNKYLETCITRTIELFEAVSETRNGNDIEFFVQQPNGQYVFYPMQAKILYPSLKYEKIPYTTTGSTVSQTDKLINYAKKTNGIPLYLLYNYSPVYDSKLNNYGCSIVDANYIKKHHYKKNPTFNDFHVNSTGGQIVASPWYILVCPEFEDDSLTRTIIGTPHTKSYTKKELLDNNEWKKLSFNEALTLDKEPYGDFVEQENFSPKYRIVINNKNEDRLD
ncbi:hypothetical protein [Sulfurimonas sp.]|uniref:hypothetical protein n=1 Tax=Sulfurimonas sp. TaxID=2022749 RepID=UPI00356AD9DF